MSTAAPRKDIQGLRALAVALVVIFHLSPIALPGGYIGVDVFFVISGFLITAHLLREVQRTGTIKLSEFWARRMRRLLPAALLALAVSAALVLLVFPESIRIQNFIEIAFASVYVLNWNLAANSVDYLGAHNVPSIAQHYWSLSVEEQFYIVWPILILIAVFVATRMKVSRARAIGVVLIVVFAASLAFSIIETARSQPSAYFVTTTRAWEFAAGGLIAMMPVLRLRRVIRIGLSWVALAAIVVPAFTFNGATAFPGWIALIPVAGTAALLFMGDNDDDWSAQYFAHAGPVQWLGDISYSVYLWHWPVIVLYMTIVGRQPGLKVIAVMVAITLLLGALSKRFVEDPIRNSRGSVKRRGVTYSLTAAGMAVVLAMSLIPSFVMQARADEVHEEVAAGANDPTSCFGAYAILNNCVDPYAVTSTVDPASTREDQFTDTGLSETGACTPGADEATEMNCVLNTGDGMKVVAIGDSHLSHIVTPLAGVARDENWNARSVTRVGCSGFESAPEGSNPGLQACAAWGEQMFADALNDPDVSLVIFAVRESVKSVELIGDNARERMAALREAGKHVVIITEAPGMKDAWPPQPGVEPQMGPSCVEAAGDTYDPCAWAPPQGADWFIDAANAAGATVINMRDMLCSADGLCHAVIGGTIVYFDESHLATTFATTLQPWLSERIRAAVGAS